MGKRKKDTRGKMLEQILHKFNLLCMNKIEETYYKAYDDWKSIIDLTLANITIAPELISSKEYDLRGSHHFLIIIRKERKNSTKHQQRWRIKRANLIQFQKKHNNNQNTRPKINRGGI